MDYLQAIKTTKAIQKYLNLNYKNTDYKRYIKYQIEHYNYINDNISFKKLINIGLKELENNNYKYLELEKKVNSYNGKKRRIEKRIKQMDPNKIWFATYTINDNNMNKDHVRKLKELLKENKYIINSDYGDKNNRLHYHAIIESEEEPKNWEYGFCKFLKIENYNTQALSKYLNKLTNHSIKETTKKIIYSRMKKTQ